MTFYITALQALVLFEAAVSLPGCLTTKMIKWHGLYRYNFGVVTRISLHLLYAMGYKPTSLLSYYRIPNAEASRFNSCFFKERGQLS